MSGYDPQLVRLSLRLDDLEEEGLLATELESAPEYDRIRSHRDAADALRSLDIEGARGLLADAAIAAIAWTRSRNDQQQTMPMLIRCAELAGWDRADLSRLARAVVREALMFGAVPLVENIDLLAPHTGSNRPDRLRPFEGPPSGFPGAVVGPTELLARGGVYAQLYRTELEEELAA